MKNLKDYILHLDNWIPKNIIDTSLKELSNDKTWQRHTFTNPRTFKSGFSPIRFNRYNKDQIMSKHCDHIVSLFEGKNRGIPILSIVAVLNDNYKGGEFIMFDDYEIKFKAGDLIIFPSVFLYPHLVKPVKKGIRYSFVSWAW